jgi:hypothetical protein
MPASVFCDIHQGLPVARGRSASYYLFQESGRRLLVVPRKQQQRIRINGKIDLVVLDVAENEVRLAIVDPDEGKR